MPKAVENNMGCAPDFNAGVGFMTPEISKKADAGVQFIEPDNRA